MKAYIIDASVAVKWYIPEAKSKEAVKYLDLYERNRATLLAPDLIIAELGNVLLKKIKSEELLAEDAAEIADLFTRLCPLKLVTAKELLPAALELAGNLELTVYDSLYLSLALLTETSLVTADRQLKKAADQHRLHRIVTLL